MSRLFQKEVKAKEKIINTLEYEVETQVGLNYLSLREAAKKVIFLSGPALKALPPSPLKKNFIFCGFPYIIPFIRSRHRLKSRIYYDESYPALRSSGSLIKLIMIIPIKLDMTSWT